MSSLSFDPPLKIVLFMSFHIGQRVEKGINLKRIKQTPWKEPNLQVSTSSLKALGIIQEAKSQWTSEW